MSVTVAPASAPPTDGAGTLQTFTAPAAGANFSTTVPTGQAWRIWGGSCRLVTSATTGGRQPGFFAGMGSIPFYVASTNLNVSPSTTSTVVFYDQELFYTQIFYSTWVPIGLRSIWLPAGSTVKFQIANIQAGDQIDQVAMLLETVRT